jgi:hypothetical protein
MSVLNAVQIVESFWANVWVARNPEVVDRHVVDDLIITSAGKRFGQGMPSGNGYASFRRESPVFNSRLSRVFRMLKVIVWPRGDAFAVAITASLDFLPISGL